MPSIPCPHCGRSISDKSMRCLYCAKPLDGVGAADADKRARMLSAMYAGGVGLPPAAKQSLFDRLHDEPLLVKVAAGILLVLPLGILWPPLGWRKMKELFRP